MTAKGRHIHIGCAVRIYISKKIYFLRFVFSFSLSQFFFSCSFSYTYIHCSLILVHFLCIIQWWYSHSFYFFMAATSWCWGPIMPQKWTLDNDNSCVIVSIFFSLYLCLAHSKLVWSVSVNTSASIYICVCVCDRTHIKWLLSCHRWWFTNNDTDNDDYIISNSKRNKMSQGFSLFSCDVW